jgi:hypothetical protein
MAWWLLVVLPGVLSIAGAFGHYEDTTGTVLTGALAGWWVGCYVAQLAMVYVMGHVLGHTRPWWFLVASMLPWIVDWASAASLGTGLVAIAVAGGFAVLIAELSLRTAALDSHGIQVDATVVEVLRNRMNVVINNVYVRRRVRVEFALPGGPAQRRVIAMICEIGTGPSPGDHVKLRVDPRHPRHVAVDPTELTT